MVLYVEWPFSILNSLASQVFGEMMTPVGLADSRRSGKGEDNDEG
jgi:hypothetical protein